MADKSVANFVQRQRDMLFALRFHLDESRKIISQGKLAVVTSRWLLDKIEAKSQARQQPSEE